MIYFFQSEQFNYQLVQFSKIISVYLFPLIVLQNSSDSLFVFGNKVHLYQSSFVPRLIVPRFICTKMKNRSHLYQNYSTRFLIGRIVSQRIITLIFYCSNRKKVNIRIVATIVAPTCYELANRGYTPKFLNFVIFLQKKARVKNFTDIFLYSYIFHFIFVLKNSA